MTKGATKTRKGAKTTKKATPVEAELMSPATSALIRQAQEGPTEMVRVDPMAISGEVKTVANVRDVAAIEVTTRRRALNARDVQLGQRAKATAKAATDKRTAVSELVKAFCQEKLAEEFLLAKPLFADMPKGTVPQKTVGGHSFCGEDYALIALSVTFAANAPAKDDEEAEPISTGVNRTRRFDVPKEIRQLYRDIDALDEEYQATEALRLDIKREIQRTNSSEYRDEAASNISRSHLMAHDTGKRWVADMDARAVAGLEHLLEDQEN